MAECRDGETAGREGRATGAPSPAAGEALVAGATRALLARVRAEGGSDVAIGWKIGINDPRMLRRLALDRSVVGVLRRDAQLARGPVPVAPEAKIVVEPELALLVARDVAAGTPPAAAVRALAGIAPALEVLDFAHLTGDLRAAIACNVFHVAALLPDAPAAAPEALPALRVVLPAPGGEREVRPADALDPFGAIVALVAERLEAAGERLRAGDRILSGAFAPAMPLAVGQRLEVRFGALGTLAVAREPARVVGEAAG